MTTTPLLTFLVDFALYFRVRTVLIHSPAENGAFEQSGDATIQETFEQLSNLYSRPVYLEVTQNDNDLHRFCENYMAESGATLILTDTIPHGIRSNSNCFRENSLWLPTTFPDTTGINLRFDSNVFSLAYSDERGREKLEVFEWYQLPRGPKTWRHVATWEQSKGLTSAEPNVWKRRSNFEGVQLKCGVVHFPLSLFVKKTETGSLRVYGFAHSLYDGLRVNIFCLYNYHSTLTLFLRWG